MEQQQVQQELPLAFIRGEAVFEKPEDLFIPPDALEVILESFEGPLDLLLYLIKKHKFDIENLPIYPITQQYMEYVELMKDMRLELAGEYLVMAAVLAEIKSRILLPKRVEAEEEEDPRAELIRRLREYEQIKKAAVDLDHLPRLERDTHLAKASKPDSAVPEKLLPQVSLAELGKAFADILKRAEAFQHHQIKRENLSTRERMSQILDAMTEARFYLFSGFFAPEEGKAGVVVTFLATLELVKLSLVELTQGEVFGEIYLRKPEES